MRPPTAALGLIVTFLFSLPFALKAADGDLDPASPPTAWMSRTGVWTMPML